jgi:hypothetical protein
LLQSLQWRPGQEDRESLSLAAVASVLVSVVWLARSHAESLKQFIDHHAMDVIGYVLGLFTEMTWPTYALATALGLTPSAFILAYIGKTPRAYDIIMFGIGGAVLGWIMYSTRRGARTPAIAFLAAKNEGHRSRSHAGRSKRRPSRTKRFTAVFVGVALLWSGSGATLPTGRATTWASAANGDPATRTARQPQQW